MQPTFLDRSLECDCTYSPAVLLKGAGIEFNLNSFAIACTAGSWPVISVDGESNSVLGRQTKQTGGERTGAKGVICGSQSNRARIMLRGHGNHTIQDLIIGFSDDSSEDQYGVEIESSANTVDSCEIDSPSLSKTTSDPRIHIRVGVGVNGDQNTLSNNLISAIQNDGTENYGIQSTGKDCLIIGNTISGGSNGILIKQGPSRVLDNAISAQQGDAIGVNGGTHTLSGNNITQSGYGIHFLPDAGPRSFIDNNTIRDSANSCIELRSPDGFFINGNSIDGCGDTAVSLFGPTNVTVEDNTMINSGMGVGVVDGTSLFVRNNTISNVQNGIGLMKLNGQSKLSSISGNTVQKCEESAIKLYGQSNITVKDNRLANSKYGIYSENAISLAVRNNIISDILDAGINVRFSTMSSISGNSIQSGGYAAIALGLLFGPANDVKDAADTKANLTSSSSNITVEDNTLVDGTWGIYSDSVTSLVVRNNTIIDNSDSGIVILSMSSADIRSNIVNNNGGAGIQMCESLLDSTIINNTVKGNNGGGMRIASSRATSIAGNSLDSNIGYGISLCHKVTEFGAFVGMSLCAEVEGGASNKLIENFVTASTNAAEIYIGEECVDTVLEGNVAADNEDDQLLIDNQSPTTSISSGNVPNFAFTSVGPGHCLDSSSQLYNFATFILDSNTLAECEATCGNYDKTDNLVGFEVSSSACLCLFENDYLSSETPGIFGTCPGSADQCSITGTDGSGAVVSSLPAEDDRHCYKKTNYVKTDVFT